MTRSRLLNEFRQERTISSHVAYQKQRKLSYYEKLKKKLVNDLDVKRVTDN